MTYLDRPVFEFPVDWNKKQSGPVDYDLRELKIGFGAEVFAPTQLHVAHGFHVECDLNTDEEIAAFDTFFTTLKGRLQGFWFPEGQIVFRVSAGVSASQFDISDQDYAATFADHPSQYIYFKKAGQTARIAKVTAVTDNGATERVTIDANHSIDATWKAYRLHYVRLVSDTEEGEFDAEGKMTRSVKVVELPTEYAAAELGGQRVYLYHFWLEFSGPIKEWFLTSFHADFTSNAQVYTKKAINHGSIKRSTKQTRSEVAIECVYEAGLPLALFIPSNTAIPVWVEIWETTVDAPNTVTLMFRGQVMEAPLDGDKQNASCASTLDAMGDRIAGYIIGPICRKQLYDPDTCRANKASFSIAATISTIDGSAVIRCTAAALNGKPANWFALGWVETGTGQTFEVRGILQSAVISATVHEFALNAPLTHAIAAQAITLVPGCAGTRADCTTKFSNYVNFGGFPFVPKQSLAIKAMPVNATAGGKK